MSRQEEDINGKEKIISDYKIICSQLSQRIERIQASHKEEINRIEKVEFMLLIYSPLILSC